MWHPTVTAFKGSIKEQHDKINIARTHQEWYRRWMGWGKCLPGILNRSTLLNKMSQGGRARHNDYALILFSFVQFWMPGWRLRLDPAVKEESLKDRKSSVKCLKLCFGASIWYPWGRKQPFNNQKMIFITLWLVLMFAFWKVKSSVLLTLCSKFPQIIIYFSFREE